MNAGLSPAHAPELGMIEARFGRVWNEVERNHVVQTLAKAGYAFYHYGPKGDHALRRDWQSAHNPGQTRQLVALSQQVRAAGMRFGIALTPVGATHPFDDDARRILARRVAELDAIGIDDLGILFDDLRGDLPTLAERQAEVVNFCAGKTAASRVFMCPTYYSDDRLLDIVFGQRPPGYLRDLGRLLDPAISVWWTGEEVCARAIGPAHVARVATALGRRVSLWDNYPVNDGERMSRMLHLRAFTGRSADVADHVAAHAINPAIQAHLTCIPALTLPMLYAQGPSYAYGEAFLAAARQLLGDELAGMVRDDLLPLQDVGRENLADRAIRLRERYAAFDHPAAAEIVRWLDGHDQMTNHEVQTQ